jgi:hypothetical protein
MSVTNKSNKKNRGGNQVNFIPGNFEIFQFQDIILQ